MATRYIRQGECNQCGECCGGNGRPGPWSGSFLNGKLRWKLVDFQGHWPHLALLGLGQTADGRVEITTPYGKIKLKGTDYDWQWDSEGLHKPGNHECPMLAADPGDGTRPCAVVGTRFAPDVFDLYCAEGRGGDGYPKFVYEDVYDDKGRLRKTGLEEKDAWFTDYPSCSFTYIEETI